MHSYSSFIFTFFEFIFQFLVTDVFQFYEFMFTFLLLSSHLVLITSLVLWIRSNLTKIDQKWRSILSVFLVVKMLCFVRFYNVWKWPVLCYLKQFLEHYGARKLEAVFDVLISTMALSCAWLPGCLPIQSQKEMTK